MAEGLARAEAARMGKSVVAKSAGTLNLVGRRADKHAVAVCSELDIDISDHESQGITDELLAWADFTLVMEFKHAAYVRENYPEADCEVMMLGHLGGAMEIKDPIGGWRWQFRRSRKEIDRCVKAFLQQVVR
jgi:protein-tyrosine-phosphatase